MAVSSALVFGMVLLAGPASQAASVAAVPSNPGAVHASTRQYLGPTNPRQTLELVLVLQPRHADSLDADIQAMYTPGSSTYHQFLTPEQFTARYGATQATYDS